MLSSLFLTPNDLVRRQNSFTFKDHKGGTTESQLKVLHFSSDEYFDFVDFLQGGLNMTLVVGIDFTASN